MQSVKIKAKNLRKSEREEILRKTAKMMDLAEDIMEELGGYRKEFLRGLETSIREVKAGKTKKIKSLADLV
jgi:hypothetical protein